MPAPVCKHEHTRLIAQDADSQYRECLECGEILEAGEREARPNFDESLSDA
jgi:hypothetical protein